MNSESSKKRTEYSCVKSQNMMDMTNTQMSLSNKETWQLLDSDKA